MNNTQAGVSRPLLYIIANIRGQIDGKTNFFNDTVCASCQNEVLAKQYSKVKINIESYLDLWERKYNIDYIESVEFHKAHETGEILDRMEF